jgi:crossover junction endodeoxyribonuclease RuvC
MIILGVDTAIRCTGYGVVDIAGGDRISILDCGVIKNPQKAPHSECLRRIAGGIRELVKNYSPEAASIEGVFFQKNIKTAMILSLARGAVITVLAENGIPSYEYAPRKAKQAVVGTGTASKQQVATMIAAMTGISLEQMPLDSTDALALAMCHGQIAMKPGGIEFLPKSL